MPVGRFSAAAPPSANTIIADLRREEVTIR
jgi:hypothetical protein